MILWLGVGLLAYVALLLAAGAPSGARGGLLRLWSLFAAGTFAVSAPHLLWPDEQGPLLQLGNVPPGGLLRRQLRAWSRLPAVFAGTGLLLAFYDPGAWTTAWPAKALSWLEHVLVVFGTGVFAFYTYVTIGQTSQAWQEGRRGAWYRQVKEHSTAPPPVPDGLVPALFATANVFVVGALVVVAGAWGGTLGAGAGLVPGLALAGVMGGRLWRLRAVYDRHFYTTNAFYGEIFRQAGGVRVTDREPVAYEAVYWTPGRWRPHVWAALRQLDRRQPLGRIVLLGHLAFWVLAYQGAPSAAVTAFLLLFAAAQNGAVYLLATPALGPEPFQVTLQSPSGWVVTRFFVNLRWALPFALSVFAVAAASDALTLAAAAGWTGLNVAAALLTAWLVTYAAEYRYRRRYA